MSLRLKWIIGSTTLALLYLLTLIVIGDNGLVELSRLRDKERAMIGQNEILARENINLYRTIDRLKHDLVYIENVARTELGMVGKTDLVLILPEGVRKKNQ
jgi:cell division protein FtsB